jgi:hypothetical protein
MWQIALVELISPNLRRKTKQRQCSAPRFQLLVKLCSSADEIGIDRYRRLAKDSSSPAEAQQVVG